MAFNTNQTSNLFSASECLPLGEHKTESVFYVPDGKKPCCKYHGCVVADCKKLKAEFRYDGTKHCTKDNKPKGQEDTCKIRVQVRGDKSVHQGQ